MSPTKVELLKIQRPSGFFLMLLELMSSTRFTLCGLLALLAGSTLLTFPHLGWTIGASELCLSMGLAVLIASYLRMSLDDTGKIRAFGALLVIPLALLFIAHQERAQSVKGQLQLSDRPVETITVHRAGSAVAHHLGAPMQITGGEGGVVQLVYGFEDAQLAPMPEPSQRQALGPWFVELLGLNFRDASQKATVSIRHRDGEQTRIELGQGDVHTVSDRLSIRLASLGAMPSGEGHRLMFEVIKDGERSMRTVYEQLPTLDSRLGVELPHMRVDAVRRVPAHQLYVYAGGSSVALYGFLGASALVFLISAVRRVG